MRIGTAQGAAAAVLALVGWWCGSAVERFDLDVAIPPGSPTTWGRRFPAITPGPVLFPDAPDGPVTGGADTGRTVTAPARVETDVDYASPFGMVRILTWDVAGHLRWVAAPGAEAAGPVTGASGKEPLPPRPGDALHWITTAALLRLLLHPQIVSEPELIAHLIEIGEPVLPVLDAARAERALAPACDVLEERITARRFGARPIPGTSPRETMLSRFLVEELVGAYPYDPEGGFGRRFLFFADELEPALAKYTRHPDPFVRRNAVAALARLHSPTATATLARVAADTDDPVMRMRALAALGEGRALSDVRPLLTRLGGATDPVDRVALVEALGRIGSPDALDLLLELGNGAYPGDAHLLQAVLAAFVRLPVDSDGIRKLVERVRDAARRTPERFDVVDVGENRPVADVTEGRGARGKLLGQLALLWLCRTNPADAETRGEVLALLAGEAGGPVAHWSSLGPTNAMLAAIAPPVRFLYLETLHLLGDEGARALERIARERDVEPSLRGCALGSLTPDRRAAVAVEIAESDEESAEMQAYALDVLAADGSPRLQELCRRFLRACAEADGEDLSPELRYLGLRCLRILASARVLRSMDVLPLVRLVASPVRAGDAIRERVREMVKQLVAGVAARMKSSERRAKIEEILDLVIGESLHPDVTERTRSKVLKQVEGQLAGLRGHRGDPRYQEIVATEVTTSLLGPSVERLPDRARGEFASVVLLEEEILLALGREASTASVRTLVEFLEEHPRSEYRGIACLALGATGDPSVARYLVMELLAEDPFTRFCAYESLRRLTGEEHWCDWMYATSTERTVAAEKYHRWVRGR